MDLRVRENDLNAVDNAADYYNLQSHHAPRISGRVRRLAHLLRHYRPLLIPLPRLRSQAPLAAPKNACAFPSTCAATGLTTTGTTFQCLNWHIVESINYCYTLEQTYTVTLSQLQVWSPAIDSACDNLWLGYAYCVQCPADLGV